MLLAVTPTPQTLWDFLVVLMFLMAMGKMARDVFRKSPERREVSFQAEYATKRELREVKEQTEKALTEMGETLKRIEGANEERRRAVYGKIEELRREVKDDVNGVHERVTEVLSKVSELSGHIQAMTK